MTMLRWITGMPVAAMVTALLFLFMASMVSQPMGGLPPSKPIVEIKITAEVIDSPAPAPRPLPPMTEKQPPVEIEPAPSGGKPVIQVNPPELLPTDTGLVGDGAVVVAPLIRIAPAYPERCRARGAEGTVLVQFDVASDGSVINARIIESSDSCFDRVVLKTIAGWKYPPDLRGGQAVARYGLVERFSFQISEE